jgi:hypothetical protein
MVAKIFLFLGCDNKISSPGIGILVKNNRDCEVRVYDLSKTGFGKIDFHWNNRIYSQFAGKWK